MFLRFEETNVVVDVPEDAAFAKVLQAAAFDWAVVKTAEAEPASRVTRRGERYVLQSPGREPVEASAVEAVCGLLVDVVDAMIEETPSVLCLHGAAIEFANRLVVFPSRSHAGKSTLAARLASGGHTVLGDDILPLTPDDQSGVALGIAPRLRLPLPPAATEAFRRFVADNAAVDDGRYLYLDADCGALAPRGTVREIGAIVLLERHAEGPAQLSRAGESEALQTLIRQNFTSGADAAALMDRLYALVGRLPCLKLIYSDLEDATALLEERFRRWPVSTEGLARAPDAVSDIPAAAGQDSGSDGQRFRQIAGIELRQVEGDLFLADRDGVAIYHLNAIGTGIWKLLAEPTSANEAVEILAAAFPDADPVRVEQDARALFADLDAAGFIERVDQSSI
ncbi:PqqD family protein [Aliihoeflea sp. 40Bstr573]|uniref:PqqD family protein n=1 Tax=Aliihoeflea sp. 40Bstr573 TaxID=2696467 RepID=UPI002094E9D9|nr:PqqD family protein [Aliihoeflea sp. 40Bstr573]MCO6388016.1 PqqD family peptide modification chaperone [Aliihoeflea sp. 40Bstr573]